MDTPRDDSGRPALSGNSMRLVRGLVICTLVVVLVGVFTAWFTHRFADQFAADKQAKARADIEYVLGALEEYKNANGRYPEALAALWVPDARGFQYLSPKNPPRDPWGNGYLYAPPGPGEARPRVWTLGRDKREGGDGESTDVTSWEDAHANSVQGR